MGNESSRTPFPSDPRVYSFGGMDGWQEGIENEGDADAYYIHLQKKLEELGVVVPFNAKILEIGSGNSVFLRYLQKLGLDAIGVDAKPRGEKAANIVRARIEQLPFPDETFGLVFSNAVFDSGVYHQDQLAMVKEVARVLKHGGIYFGILNWDKDTPFDQYFEVLSKSDGPIGSSVYRRK